MTAINIDFPNGMSQRDKQIILDTINQQFQERPPKTVDEARTRARSWVEEWMGLSTRTYSSADELNTLRERWR